MIGKTLAHYEITSQLGKGGMGEVYRAKDQVLGRDVAIKVLPEEFAEDAERVARFQREAKLLASLNHPNIAAIHGLEESQGTHFLVLELIEGETLADQIKAGAIPIEEALKLALQIAEALEAAHERGVIHRDLKPANIKVTPDGKVKVLDFGLAKAFAGEHQKLNLSNSPTLSNAATQQGVILGTAAYMSPEQARGESVDRKADIWAFGCVLFEMLTGRATFEGRTVSDILASVIKSEPEWKRLPLNLHPRVRLMLERCLEKEAKNRYNGVGDARVDIQKGLADPSGMAAQPGTAMEPRRKLWAVLPWVAAALFLGASLAGVAVWKIGKTKSRQVMCFYDELPEAQQFNMGGSRTPLLAISPDGRQLVYCTMKGLYLRSVDELTAELIPGTEGSTQKPFFSPDGKSIGYWSRSDNQLKKIAISGGTPVPLTSDPSVGPLDWSLDNTIIYAYGHGIYRISPDRGNSGMLIEEKECLISSPQMLPDGKSVLYTHSTGVAQGNVMVHSLKSGNSRIVLEGGDAARYIKTGHIVYMVGNDLWAVPFDVDTLEVTGESVPLVKGVVNQSYAISESGTLVYISGTADAANRTLVWVDKNGGEELLAAAANAYSWLKISPDGDKVALAVGPLGHEDIWIYDLLHKNLRPLTFDKAGNNAAVWTSDSKRIIVSCDRERKIGSVYSMAANGTGEIEQLVSDPNQTPRPWSLSKDGKILLMLEVGANGNDIGMLSMEGDHARKLLLGGKYDESDPQISPDGRWMAYTSNEWGLNDVFVCTLPEVEKGRWQISTNGGNSPLWSRNGKELYYRNGDAVLAVAVETEPSFKLGEPKNLFSGTYYSTDILQISHTPWDIDRSGKRFLMIKSPAEIPRKINVVLNWIEELKQKVLTK
jgi:Tol biopolymer transport system component